MHFHLFVSIAEAAFTTASSGIEGEVARLNLLGLGFFSSSEELADGIECSRINSWCRTWRAGEWRLVNQLHTFELVRTFEQCDWCRFVFVRNEEVLSEVEVEDVVS